MLFDLLVKPQGWFGAVMVANFAIAAFCFLHCWLARGRAHPKIAGMLDDSPERTTQLGLAGTLIGITSALGILGGGAKASAEGLLSALAVASISTLFALGQNLLAGYLRRFLEV